MNKYNILCWLATVLKNEVENSGLFAGDNNLHQRTLGGQISRRPKILRYIPFSTGFLSVEVFFLFSLMIGEHGGDIQRTISIYKKNKEPGPAGCLFGFFYRKVPGFLQRSQRVAACSPVFLCVLCVIFSAAKFSLFKSPCINSEEVVLRINFFNPIKTPTHENSLFILCFIFSH